MQLWQPSLPEKYTTMPGDELAAAITARRKQLGDRLIILGHHYQVDEVIRHADFTGDSLKLSQLAAEQVNKQNAEFVVFCGVHFMAESADLLTPESVAVILPDMSAGCSMADMADYEDAIDAWELIHKTLNEQHKGKAGGWGGRVIPITYVNSTAAVKAFVGANGGACCTSSNAKRVFEWALAGGTIPKGKKEDIKILFLPDQHLGRNTAASFGIDVAKHSCVYDPRATRRGEGVGGATEKQINDARVILWAGHCSVHKLFRPEHCDEIRALDPEMKILVHPECAKEVVDKSDLAGSTEFIIKTIREAKPGSKWAVGTEVHLVNRIAREAESRGVTVRILSSCQCLCTTMYRIDEPHLLWVLDHLAQGKVVNRVQVHPDARTPALEALDRMLALVDAPALVD
ncbi:MAG: quinolinate synthase NadA [Phycisphaerales bacterium]|nr:quinolinate synthase NadA [Phycisphaerales bacterium]